MSKGVPSRKEPSKPDGETYIFMYKEYIRSSNADKRTPNNCSTLLACAFALAAGMTAHRYPLTKDESGNRAKG